MRAFTNGIKDKSTEQVFQFVFKCNAFGTGYEPSASRAEL